MVRRTAQPCVVCQRDDAIPERGLVCEHCRYPLPRFLAGIVRMYGELDVERGSGGGAVRVSGTREAPLPLSVDVLDLTLDARAGALSRQGRELAAKFGDQVGRLSVATVLDGWVRDWCEKRGEHLPVPTVATLARWLSDRLDWACDHHDAVDEFVADIRSLHGVLRSTTGDVAAPPKKLPAPCNACDHLTLFRHAGDAYPVRCHWDGCGAALTEDEYTRWSGQVVAFMRTEAAA